MNRLLFTAIVLAGWILFAAINRGSFFSNISATPINTSNSIDNSLPTIGHSDLKEDSLQNQIQSELYNSISTGMSYAEVSSIIGWEGTLIYENNINDGLKPITIKVYRWNLDDVYSDSLTSNELVNKNNAHLNNYLILEFQNNILIELNSSQNIY